MTFLLLFSLIQAMIDPFACMQTVQQNAYDQDPYANEFGIKISEKLASVEARILPAPWVMLSLFTFSCLFKNIFSLFTI